MYTPVHLHDFMEERRGSVMAAIDSAYHYYLTTYGQSATSRYDTHKKSELRNIYNSMVKINKESPLFKLSHDNNVPKFLIDIKENARQVQNVVASLSDSSEGLENAFQKKVAVSSDEDIVTASYVGSSDKNDASQTFDIEVRQLAAPQSNLGNFLNSHAKDIQPGNYSFDLTTTANAYEFQYTVTADEDNLAVQEKLARLVNSAGVGLTAEVITDEKNRSALKLTSKQTGLTENETSLFEIKPSASADSIAAMELLGFHQITSPAKNSSFILDGKESSSYTNTFTINQVFEVNLHGISEEDKPTNIGFKTSVDAVEDNLQELVDAYNNFIHVGEKYAESSQGNRLLTDMKSVSFAYRNNLESIGLIVNDNGTISIDKNLLADTLETDDPSETFSVLNSFKKSLSVKANNASLNPIKYVDKIVVAYKKPGGNFPSPYYSSLYSGLMLDRYC